MGAIHAIERGDHKQAMAWFEQAVPLLESPTPASSTVNKARHGETFVSMAISYWEAEQQDEALRLTRQGMELMEQRRSRRAIGQSGAGRALRQSGPHARTAGRPERRPAIQRSGHAGPRWARGKRLARFVPIRVGPISLSTVSVSPSALFVGRRAVHSRHGHIVETQVNAQMSAMMDGVVDDEVANHAVARHGDDWLPLPRVATTPS